MPSGEVKEVKIYPKTVLRWLEGKLPGNLTLDIDATDLLHAPHAVQSADNTAYCIAYTERVKNGILTWFGCSV